MDTRYCNSFSFSLWLYNYWEYVIDCVFAFFWDHLNYQVFTTQFSIKTAFYSLILFCKYIVHVFPFLYQDCYPERPISARGLKPEGRYRSRDDSSPDICSRKKRLNYSSLFNSHSFPVAGQKPLTRLTIHLANFYIVFFLYTEYSWNTACMKIDGKLDYSVDDQRHAFARYYEDLSVPKEDAFNSTYWELCY
jgi:hypothetical protein